MKPRSKRNRKRPRSELVDHYNARPVQTTLLGPHQLTTGAATGLPIVGRGGVLPSTLVLRVVHPYPYTFSSFAKSRWVGRSVLDVYCHEFGSYPESYYRMAIQQGRILVSDQRVACDYQVQAHDVLTHTVHRHEPAVTVHASGIRIVAETNDLLAVDKPSTLPVHPCGGYHQNSLMNMLELERGDKNSDDNDDNDKKLYTIHRLDRLTSGLVVLAKTSQAAQKWGRAIQERSCGKLYLARVRGRFGSSLLLPKHQQQQKIPEIYGERLPVCGEWSEETGDDNEKKDEGGFTSTNDMEKNKGECDDTDPSAELRRRNAHGYWITDSRGSPCPNVSLEDYLNLPEYSVNDWLKTIEDPSSSSSSSSSETNMAKQHMYWLNIACPVRIAQPKIGVCASGTFDDLDSATYLRTVKAAQTAFAVLHYFHHDDSTLLLVRPETGRTHQIRLHLQHVGHCIANDPNYGGQLWFGNSVGQQACEEAQQILNGKGNGDDHDAFPKDCLEDEQSSARSSSSITNNRRLVTTDTAATEGEVESTVTAEARGGDEPLEDFIRRTCVWCARSCGQSVEERAALEFLVRSPGLWLHAFQYTLESSSFRTDLPEWSQFQDSTETKGIENEALVD